MGQIPGSHPRNVFLVPSNDAALARCIVECRYLLKDKFARHTGYNEVAELNNIILIYPQATAIVDNPLGCWDWWGYTVKFYRK